MRYIFFAVLCLSASCSTFDRPLMDASDHIANKTILPRYIIYVQTDDKLTEDQKEIYILEAKVYQKLVEELKKDNKKESEGK